VNAEIRKALYRAIDSVNCGVPIVWPNVTPDKNPLECLHVRVNVLPLQTEAVGVCAIDWHRGILQVAVYDRHGAGEIRALEIADIFARALPRGHEIYVDGYLLRFDRAPSLIPAVQTDNGWYFIPVQFLYNLIS
jgi:hypothetical protein